MLEICSEPRSYHPFAVCFALCDVIWIDGNQAMHFCLYGLDGTILPESVIKCGLDRRAATGVDLRLLWIRGLVVGTLFGKLMVAVALKVTNMAGRSWFAYWARCPR